MAMALNTVSHRGVLMGKLRPHHAGVVGAALIMLLARSVRGHALRLVHRQRRGDQQHRQRSPGIGHELNSQPEGRDRAHPADR